MKKLLYKIILITILLVLVYIILILIYKYIFFPKKYSNIVEETSKIYNVDPNLIYAVIKQESKFNSNAVSSSGAKGLMQIMDNTAKDMARKITDIDENNIDLFDPYTNILIGTKYLSYLIKHYNGNYYLAITAYNAGMGKVDNWVNKEYESYTDFSILFDVIEYNETKIYLTNVINYYKYYTNLY